jgi:hypothetical protein
MVRDRVRHRVRVRDRVRDKDRVMVRFRVRVRAKVKVKVKVKVSVTFSTASPSTFLSSAFAGLGGMVALASPAFTASRLHLLPHTCTRKVRP